MSPVREQRLLPALTGLRFLAAFYVVLFHFARWYVTGGPPWIKNLVDSGYVGVDLFFVLSGFVLTYTYLRPGVEHVSAREFWIARIARVYPMYLLAFALAIPLALKSVHHWYWSDIFTTGGGIVASAFLVQAWLPQTATVINGPGWSLSVEAFFYLVFPFVGVTLARLRGRRLILTVLILWASFLLVTLAYVLVYGSGTGISLGEMAVAYNPALNLPEFLTGVACALAFARGWQPLGRWLAPVSLGGALVILAFSSYIPPLLIQNGLLAPLFALALLGLAGGSGLLVRFLSWKPLTVLGEASYSIYILQVPLWYLLLEISRRLLHSQTPYLGRPVYFIGYSIALISISVVALYSIEVPMRRAIRKRFGVRRAIPDAPAVGDLARAPAIQPLTHE
jgi:peptidoglycan/LPS O-acetylase OafA/YrhL